ncbi:MAG: hypothetical protein GY821_17510 [Gammaproteobacteria bacterium]|nr:hypothetical protein [Gammaproteobacteria bacterium]
MIKQLALAAVEQGVNQLLAWDPLVNEQMQPLYGTVVAIEISDLNLLFYFNFDDGHIAVQSDLIGEADLTVRGELAAFVKMGLQYSRDTLPSGLEIIGDASLAQQLQRFMAVARIDWEEILAQLSGDFVATRFGHIFRRSRGEMARNRENLCANATEFLHYEGQILPARQEVDSFCQQVDHLRHDVARLQARIDRFLIQRGKSVRG